jgi:protoporphyrinogen oxidase
VKPNDIGFLKLWEDQLKKNNVTLMNKTEVIDFKVENNKIINVKLNNNTVINGENFILAMPPHNINNLISKYKLLKYSFGQNFSQWSEKTNYITYIPVVFHWNKKLKIKRKWGFPQKDWGIIHIILSEYMEFNDSRSQTVISASITKHEKSPVLNKTPDELQEWWYSLDDEDQSYAMEIIMEYRQILEEPIVEDLTLARDLLKQFML